MIRPHPDPATERALATTGRTSDDDVLWLVDHAKGRDVIIELGPYQGRSTLALAAGSTGVIYAIDNWNAAINHWQPDRSARAACHENLADLITAGRVQLLEHDSQAGVPAALEGIRADMLWIDADHGLEAVRSDIRFFAPLIKSGGLVCGHDYSVWHPEVMRAVDEAYGHRVQRISIHRSIWWVWV